MCSTLLGRNKHHHYCIKNLKKEKKHLKCCTIVFLSLYLSLVKRLLLLSPLRFPAIPPPLPLQLLWWRSPWWRHTRPWWICSWRRHPWSWRIGSRRRHSWSRWIRSRWRHTGWRHTGRGHTGRHASAVSHRSSHHLRPWLHHAHSRPADAADGAGEPRGSLAWGHGGDAPAGSSAHTWAAWGGSRRPELRLARWWRPFDRHGYHLFSSQNH